ncbi:MAG: nuclear transport factor 2 family protein [Roseimicrobium sp.]
MIADTISTDDEAALRELTHCLVEAIHSKNLATLQKFYAEDVVLYDAAPPLQTEGSETFIKNTGEWFATWSGPIGLELQDLQIHVSGDVALTHSLNHLTGERTGEDDTDVWMRMTLGWRKIDGTWLIIHEHTSVPMYMEPPFKAAIDLKP